MEANTALLPPRSLFVPSRMGVRRVVSASKEYYMSLKHEPTPGTRKMVMTLSGYGIPEDGIAAEIGISKPTLIKYYRRELDVGMTKANAQVAQNLFKKATGDGASSVTAAIFWCKTRMGWRETVLNQHAGEDGGPVRIIWGGKQE